VTRKPARPRETESAASGPGRHDRSLDSSRATGMAASLVGPPRGLPGQGKGADDRRRLRFGVPVTQRAKGLPPGLLGSQVKRIYIMVSSSRAAFRIERIGQLIVISGSRNRNPVTSLSGWRRTLMCSLTRSGWCDHRDRGACWRVLGRHQSRGRRRTGGVLSRTNLSRLTIPTFGSATSMPAGA
jgi:hypothetical protein